MTRFSSAQRRRAKMQSSDKRPIGPWRAFRIGLRVVLFSFLTWLVLALLWAFLPSPATIQSEEHATSILRSGSPLTVAYPSSKWHDGQYDRQGFVLDYTLHDADSPSASLAISGYPQLIPLINREFTPNNGSEITQNFQAVARTGDTDGANLPWFTFADSVLLYWWIHRENMDVDLSARWVLLYEYETPEAMLPVLRSRQLEILFVNRLYQPLLTIDMDNKWEDEKASISKIAMGEESDSPTWTYPIRVAIIYVLAPATVFVNDWFGSTIGYGFQAFETVFLILFGILVYGFVISAFVVSVWRCCGGPGLESMVDRVQRRLDGWREEGRYTWLRTDMLQERIDQFFGYERVQSALRVCREGWHPERDKERLAREQEQLDEVEKGNGGVKIRIRK